MRLWSLIGLNSLLLLKPFIPIRHPLDAFFNRYGSVLRPIISYFAFFDRTSLPLLSRFPLFLLHLWRRLLRLPLLVKLQFILSTIINRLANLIIVAFKIFWNMIDLILVDLLRELISLLNTLLCVLEYVASTHVAWVIMQDVYHGGVDLAELREVATIP